MNASDRILSRLVWAAVLAVIGISLAPRWAGAGVIQEVTVTVSGQPDAATIFGVTSADIDHDIFAAVANGGGRARATGAINRFGSLGLDLFTPAMASLSARVLIASDEFVNTSDSTQRILATAIID